MSSLIFDKIAFAAIVTRHGARTPISIDILNKEANFGAFEIDSPTVLTAQGMR